MLLVHGGGHNSGVWHATATRLVGDWNVAAMDLPGHGLSRRLVRWSWAEALDDLDAVVEMFSPEVVIGHSLGGMLAVLRAARTPPIGGAILIDGWIGDPLPDILRDARFKPHLEQIAARTHRYHSLADAMRVLRNEFEDEGVRWSEAEPLARRSFVRDGAEWARRPTPGEMRALYLGLHPVDLVSALKTSLCAVAAVMACGMDALPWWNDHDKRAAVKAKSELIELLRTRLGPHRVEVMNAGHNLPLLDPDGVATHIDSLTRSLLRARVAAVPKP